LNDPLASVVDSISVVVVLFAYDATAESRSLRHKPRHCGSAIQLNVDVLSAAK